MPKRNTALSTALHMAITEAKACDDVDLAEILKKIVL